MQALASWVPPARRARSYCHAPAPSLTSASMNARCAASPPVRRHARVTSLSMTSRSAKRTRGGGERHDRQLRCHRDRHRPVRAGARPPPGAAGKRVAIVERKRFGGTCVNNGCIPTKTLIASARAAHVARRAADFGVVIDGPDPGRHEGGQGAQGRDRQGLQRGSRGRAARGRRHHRLRRPRPLRRAEGGDGRRRACSRPTRSSSTSAVAPISRRSPASMPCPISTTPR